MIKLKQVVNLLCIFLLLACSAESVPEQQGRENEKVNDKDGAMILGLLVGKETKKYVLASPLSGVLVKAGKPLANTKIIRRLTWNANGEGIVEEFMTDDQGRFSIPVYEDTFTMHRLT